MTTETGAAAGGGGPAIGATASLADRARRAINDTDLQTALGKVTAALGAEGAANRTDPVMIEARRRGAAIRREVLDDLDGWLDRLQAKLESLGITVHRAAGPEDARQVVLGIARAEGVRLAVKSKSMATEEIHLNAALEADGIEVVETDLGEYIIQLAHEMPSHIIAPAVHKTVPQVARLFTEVAGHTLPDDRTALCAFARERLRSKFLAADMGITGVNFAAVDTGTLVLVTNEGNGRMVTSLPRVHVAVMGVEKVVPSMSDLMVFLAILAKSATGQKLSVYTTLVQGPRRAGELEGPEEFHLVLLDNGRVDQLAGPLREALYCLRCGACLNVCPVYRQIGGHAYGHTYPGPIGILLTAMLNGPGSVKELAHASSLCGACADACPVRIDIPRMLIELRRQVDEKRIAPWIERVVFESFGWLLARPLLYGLAGRIARVLQRPFVRDGAIRSLPLFFGDWTRTRDLPAVAPRTFHERWKELAREAPP